MTDSNRTLKILGFGVICAVIAFFFLDHPLGMWLRQKSLPGDVRRFIDCGEWFGHGTGTFQVILALYFLDPANRRKILRVAACAVVPGLVAVLVKMFILRTRPHAFDYSYAIEQTFTGWNFFHKISSDFQSFPSGHTATAVGLALGLAWLYPHGRKLFWILAIWVAIQRMASEAHFLSDTICGAMLGFLVAGCLLPHGPLSWGFDRCENGK